MAEANKTWGEISMSEKIEAAMAMPGTCFVAVQATGGGGFIQRFTSR